MDGPWRPHPPRTHRGWTRPNAGGMANANPCRLASLLPAPCGHWPVFQPAASVLPEQHWIRMRSIGTRPPSAPSRTVFPDTAEHPRSATLPAPGHGPSTGQRGGQARCRCPGSSASPTVNRLRLQHERGVRRSRGRTRSAVPSWRIPFNGSSAPQRPIRVPSIFAPPVHTPMAVPKLVRKKFTITRATRFFHQPRRVAVSSRRARKSA